jgi:hypothetical protein
MPKGKKPNPFMKKMMGKDAKPNKESMPAKMKSRGKRKM